MLTSVASRTPGHYKLVGSGCHYELVSIGGRYLSIGIGVCYESISIGGRYESVKIAGRNSYRTHIATNLFHFYWIQRGIYNA